MPSADPCCKAGRLSARSLTIRLPRRLSLDRRGPAVCGLLFVALAGCAATTPPSEPRLVGSPPPAAENRVDTSPTSPTIVLRAVEQVETPTSSATRVVEASGRRISIDLRQAHVHDVLRLLAAEGEMNVVVDPRVGGRVTMRLRDVTIEEALFAVLQAVGAGMERKGEIVTIAPGGG